MTNHSDYTKTRTDFLQILPEVYQSDVNVSLFETLFNRFLTKSELRRVIGYIGQGNPNALVNRQIQEPTPHRQAYQLQPIIYERIGTVEHMASWKDIQNELERLGVDLSKMKEWGNSLSFNFAPPIDYDKIINYRDYYWYNSDDVSDSPQYVTIQNPCVRVEAKIDEYENTLAEFGSTFTIIGLDSSAKTFTISDNLTDIFVENFLFYVKDSTNSTINNKYYTVVSSSYNTTTDSTDIVVDESGSPLPFDDSIINGNISLEELLSVYESERDCICDGTLGWDGGLWDDNQVGDVIWNKALIESISSDTPLTGSPLPEYSLWYDTVNDQLKQLVGTGSPNNWVVVQSEFSKILAVTTGGEFWDFSAACTIETNPWIEQNKWLHKNQVPNFTIAKQAQIPIIEFIPTIGLNEWSETTYEWKYRVEPSIQEFSDTTAQPNLFELIGIDTYTVEGSPAKDIVFDSKYGDLTSVFVPGYTFLMSGNSNSLNNITYTTVYSTYCEQIKDEKFQTKVHIAETFDSSTGSPFDGMFIPVYTSLGDTYTGLYQHWLFVGIKESNPTSSQPLNPMLTIPTNPPPDSFDFIAGSPSAVYGSYVLSLFAQEITVTTGCFSSIIISGVSTGSPNNWILEGEHVDVFNAFDVKGRTLVVSDNTGGANGEYTIKNYYLSGGKTVVEVQEEIPSTVTATGTAYVYWVLEFDSTLQNQTRFESNELRIYIDDERQYGTYDEVNAGAGSPPVCGDFVNSVIMKTPVDQYSVIRIEVGAAVGSDIGYENVLVRTNEDDVTFTVNDLICVSLVHFRKLEQIKTKTNQYPLFDLFDVEGVSLHVASRIFGFQESQDASIDQYFGRRIVHSADRREYYYEQYLIDEDNGPLFAYRDTSIGESFWFDTDNDILYCWTGDTWDTKILTSNYSIGSPQPLVCYLTPIVSNESPGSPWIDINGMIWFNLNDNSIYVSYGDESSPKTWTKDELLTSGVIFSKTDPTLTTIWRTGPSDVPCEQREMYVPEYVDENRNPVPITVGSPPLSNEDGDWEIPDQLYYNYSHENRKVLSSSQLLAHFLSIISEQEVPPGIFGSADTLFHILTNVNYGKGGKIKEFNDSYDSFLSSIFIQNVNPLQLYEFAHDAYETSLNQIKEIFRSNVGIFMTDITEDAVADLSSNVANLVIEQYEENDFNNLVYGDSNTYIQDTDTGVRNWPATLPFVRLAFKVQPQLLIDSVLGLNEIRHHDGHLSHIQFASTSTNAFNLRIINTTDTRVTNPTGKMGVQSTSGPPEQFADYYNVFGYTSACYWYEVTSTSRTLYRMTAVRISTSSAPPPVTFPEGTYWYDITNNRLKVLSGVTSPGALVWTNATSSVGLLTEGGTSAWEEINLDTILAKVILEIETRLYEAAPDLDELSFDFSETFADNPSLTSEYYEDAFFEFIVQAQITSPFDITYDDEDPFTWNYVYSSPSVCPSIITYEAGGTWQDVYQKRYGTPYPHLEPWILQGYSSEPTWWNDMYVDTTGTRRWVSSMWSNIFEGKVPAGMVLPDGSISTGITGEVQQYDFVSVNTLSVDFIDEDGNTYEPDELFPPYINVPSTCSPSISSSLFRDFSTEISNSDTDYQYGDAGLVEWTWRNSSQYLYDSLKVAFRLQPLKFIHFTLGEEFLEIGCLEVSQRTQKVYAHQDAAFHGDLLSDNTILKFQGTLQWYINYNRYNGYDSSSSNFRPMWTEWTAPLGYQFSTFIDTGSLLVSNSNFDTVEQDYKVRIKRSPGIDDHWIDALDVTLTKAPPTSLRYDTESQWQFNLSSYSPIGRSIQYYASQAFPFIVNTSGSPETYIMEINDPYSRTLPWQTGDVVVVSSTGFLPSPLLAETQYYVIKSSSTEFQLSTQSGGVAIEILSDGSGTHTVAKVSHSFQALNGQVTEKIWYAYELDKDLILTLRFPTGVIGIETLINIIFGYVAYEEDNENFRFNFEATDVDTDYDNRVVNWQLEVEKLINFAYQARDNLTRRQDSYEFTADDSPIVFNFITVATYDTHSQVIETLNAPAWNTGQQVTISSTGTLPEPLLTNVFYYVIRDSSSTFRLALTRKNARNGIGITITSAGTGTLSIQDVLVRDNLPSQEVNPFKYNLWITTPQGIVADIFKGPFFDIRTDQLLFDQFKDRLPNDHVIALRQDKITRILVHRNIVTPLSQTETAHLTSAHIFIDGYEHVMLFNDYASNGALIYDSFIGLNTPKFDVQYDRSSEFTLRPNVGGYVLLNQQDVDLSSRLVRNIEGQVEDLRYVYDTYKVVESNNLVAEGRNSIGYDGPYDFLSNININPKSQFVFWRGMIQAKGSVNSVKAFINSRRFVDAKIDEFWAYQVATFGDNKEFNLPEINLFVDDTRTGEIRLHFVDTVGTAERGFIEVTTQDQERWYEYPNQQDFFNTIGNMYFNVGIDYVDITNTDYIKPVGSPGTYYIELPFPADEVVITGDVIPSYTQINSQTLEFTGLGSPLPDLRIYLIVPYESKHNPCKIRDILEEVTISDAILWDPARGDHYHNAIHLVDIQRNDDAAVYEYQINEATGDAEEIFADSYDPWGAKEVGTTWLDINELEFVPYSDVFINSSILNRLKYWGRLAGWASYRMYQWTESDVSPDEYDLLAEEQEGDFSIDSLIRVTGRTRKEIWKFIGGSPTSSPLKMWELYPFEKYHIGSRLYFNVNNIPFDISSDEPATLYKNGELVGTYESKSSIENDVMSPSPTVFTNNDFVTVVKFIPTADGVTYKEVTPYSTEQVLVNNVPTTKYYFWVENKTVVESTRNKDISMLQAVQELETIPVPYVVPQNLQSSVTETTINPSSSPLGSPLGSPNGSPLGTSKVVNEILPRRYTQAILRNYGTLINADNRYVLRFTRNFVLRDNLFDNVDRSPTELKTIHQEWELFRKEQPYNVARELWNLMIESVIGQKISSLGNITVRVPSLNRELFDSEYNTSTRIGITQSGQSFCDGEKAWDAILQYLQDGNNDFTPVDIQTFFETYDILNLTPRFSTDAQTIYNMLDELYNTFTYTNVNRIFFSVFNTSALPYQSKYEGIFKTSWIALHGIKVLEENGIYD